MTEKIYDYDPAAVLESEEAIAVFLADALDTDDSAYAARALGVVARAKRKEFANQTDEETADFSDEAGSD